MFLKYLVRFQKAKFDGVPSSLLSKIVVIVYSVIIAAAE